MSNRPRSHLTRLFHVLSLVIVIHQIVNSTFMERPLPGDDPEWPYLIHVWTGTAGLQILLCFWIWVLVRDARETRFTEFFPWFSPHRLRAIFLEIDGTLRALLKARIPSFELPAVAASVHGAGLMLATGLAATLGFQVAIIVGGVLRLFPLTGITLPFVSYGGSSLVTNFLLVALVWAISGERRRPVE